MFVPKPIHMAFQNYNRNRNSRFSPRGNFGGGFNRSRRPAHSAQIDPRAYVLKAPLQTEVKEEYVPKHQFSDFPLSDRLLQNVLAHGYKTPTPIQDEAMLHVCEGQDVVAIANTGTGKTAAFLLPIIEKITQKHDEFALIMVPTRELAIQVEDELFAFTKGINVRSLLAIGGTNIMRQIHGLRTNPRVVIATPGRLKDLIERNLINLSKFRTVVLDEVDRMVDIGFLPDVRFIVGKLATPRQSLFFSATITPEIRSVLQTFAPNPINISVKKTETTLLVDQDVVKVDTGKDKLWKLVEIAENRDYTKILVFVRTKRGADQLAKELNYERFRVAAIHGNKAQGARTRALDDFKSSRVQILVATDVAARGIDIPNVNLVINYDEPGTYEDYVHRIGRTGRAGKTGKALTFLVGR